MYDGWKKLYIYTGEILIGMNADIKRKSIHKNWIIIYDHRVSWKGAIEFKSIKAQIFFFFFNGSKLTSLTSPIELVSEIRDIAFKIIIK